MLYPIPVMNMLDLKKNVKKEHRALEFGLLALGSLPSNSHAFPSSGKRLRHAHTPRFTLSIRLVHAPSAAPGDASQAHYPSRLLPRLLLPTPQYTPKLLVC